jgi:hypothetical protein
MTDDQQPYMRAAAEEHMRALAGSGARLRDEPVDGDPRAGRRAPPCPRRAAHRLGKSAVYFVATALLCGRCRAHRHRLAAARADAQPGRRRGPGRRPRPHHQLGQPGGMGAAARRDLRRRRRRAAGQPGAAEQPQIPRQRAAVPVVRRAGLPAPDDHREQLVRADQCDRRPRGECRPTAP